MQRPAMLPVPEAPLASLEDEKTACLVASAAEIIIAGNPALWATVQETSRALDARGK